MLRKIYEPLMNRLLYYKPWQLIFACDGPSILNPKAPVSPQVSTVNLAGLLTMPLFNPGP